MKPVRTAKTIRSGGKRKRVDANGKVIKPAAAAAGKSAANGKAGSSNGTSKKSNTKTGGESDESEDEELDAARAAFFDDEDLDEDVQAGGFEGREDSLGFEEDDDEIELEGDEEHQEEDGSEADSFDLEDEPLEGEPQPGMDSDMCVVPPPRFSLHKHLISFLSADKKWTRCQDCRHQPCLVRKRPNKRSCLKWTPTRLESS